MPLNLLKVYSSLLELEYLSDIARNESLMRIFDRDIRNNVGFNFRTKVIRPIKTEEDAMQTLFKHLTCDATEVAENGVKFKKRVFDFTRSKRLHWIRYHIEEQGNVLVFSVEERIPSRGDVIRTYIHDVEQHYIIILEPQRSLQDYYFITAYHLDQLGSRKGMAKKYKKRLPVIH